MEQQSFPLSNILLNAVKYLEEQKFAFVFFKFPFSNDINLLVDSEASHAEVFCFQSFDGKEKAEIKGQLFVNEAIQEVLQIKNDRLLIKEIAQEGLYMNQSQYEAYVSDIIKEIKLSHVSKCVAARKKRIDFAPNFNLGQTYIDLLIKYPTAFCYLANTPFGLWMGATPELLLEKQGNRYFTVALAGTKQRHEQRIWTEKEKDEHQIVVDYIKDIIQKSGFEVAETSPVFDGGAGPLLHLKMDINFYADRSIHEALHPTPAVCGIPVDAAKELILKHELGNRSLYSGYFGIEGETARYYVNLRCMQIFDTHADIYVGAGITEESNPTKEWLETEAKSEVMGKLLQDL